MNFFCHIHAACYITCPFHAPSFHYSNYFWWALQIMKLLIMQRSASLCCFHPLMSKYSTQHCFQIHQVNTHSSAWDKFYTHAKQQVNIHIFIFQLLCFHIAGRKAKDYTKIVVSITSNIYPLNFLVIWPVFTYIVTVPLIWHLIICHSQFGTGGIAGCTQQFPT